MRLLLAIDLNDGAEELVAEGARWAERLRAVLDLIYVDEHSYNASLVQDPAVAALIDREWKQIREELQSRLLALRDTLPEEMRGEVLLMTGRAPEQIVEVAQKRDAVLISTHGRRGLSHLLLGSVAERVVRTATVPVLVLPRAG